MYTEKACINLENHTFKYKDETLTQKQCINKMLEGLETGMTVWSETQGEYQRVRYISTRDLKAYHWCDGWGNNVESDELYNYCKRELYK